MFKRSQLDGLRQAEEAASFVLGEVQQQKVLASEVPTPLLIGCLKRMLNEVTESRRITDPESPLNSMSYSPDGKWFATASFNGRIHLLNRENGEERSIPDRGGAVLNGAVLNVALGPDARVALASARGYARILDFDGNQLKQFPEVPADPPCPCYSVAFSADGEHLATGSMDGVARIWDINSGQCIECHGHELTIHLVSFCPTRPILLTSSWDGTARLWNSKTGDPICKYEVKEKSIYDGSFSRRGDRVATTCWAGGLAHIWNVGDEKYLRKLRTQDQHITHISFHDPDGHDPDGRRVATASWDGYARIWDWEEKSEKESYQFVPGPMSRASFSPDGDELATNQWDGVVHLWTLVKSRAKGQEEPTTVVQASGKPQMFARFSPGGDQFAVACFDKKLRLYSVRIDPLGVDPPLEEDAPHGVPLYCVAFGPSRTGRLATGSYDGTGRLWFFDGDRLDEGAPLSGHNDRIYEISFSPGGDVVATASGDGTVRLWDLDGHEKKCFRGVGVVYSAKFHPKENVVAAAWNDGSIRLIDLSGNSIGEYRTPRSSSPAFCVDFSDDGQFLGAVFGNGTACAWECCDSPDTWLVREPRRPPFSAHEGLAMGIAFSPSPGGAEPWFATSSGEGMVRLWSLNGRKLAEFKQHKDFVRGIDFHPDPTHLLLLTASVDGTVKLLKIDRSIKSLQDLHRKALNWLGDRPAQETIS